MKVGSLFAGIGGFDLAASRVWGWDCVRWQVEIEPWARRVLAKHWPNVPRFGDIRELSGEELGPVDLVCGGFPCQPFSQAGRRLGEEDPRHLWPEMRRIVEAVRPGWVVGENVPPLRRMGLDQVCADLEALGYAVGTVGLPAVSVGAPHIRQRLWIVAHRGCERRQQDARSAPADESPNGWRARGYHVASGDGEGGRAGIVAYAHGDDRHRRSGHEQVGRGGVTRKAPKDGDIRGAQWSAEPNVGRVAYGIPARVDRLRGLGNAIVPEVAERLFRWIAEAEVTA